MKTEENYVLHKKTKFRIGSLLLCVCMMLSCLPVSVFAQTDNGGTLIGQISAVGAGSTVLSSEAGGNTATDGGYGNTATVECTHQYENGICTVCGGYQQPSTDANGVYQIANAGNLYWFAQQVNAANSTINGKLTADIVVNEDLLNSLTFDDNGNVTNGDNFRIWTPICDYTGTFDGANHTVSGLYYNGDDSYAGLFGYIEGGANIKNVGMDDTYFCVLDDRSAYVAGIVANAYASGQKITISGCRNATALTVKNDEENPRELAYVGGIVAYAEATNGGSIEITKCYNTGNLDATVSYVDSYAGGIAAYVKADGGSIKLEECYSTGTLTATNTEHYAYAGGVVAYAEMENSSSLVITKCYNTGDLAANGSYEYTCVGGIAAYAEVYEQDSIEITICYNTGNLTATSTLGGTGYDDLLACAGGVLGCAVPYGILKISNCYSAGSVTSSSEEYAYSGGLVGYVPQDVVDGKMTLSNCLSVDTYSATGKTGSYVGGVIGLIGGKSETFVAVRVCYYLERFHESPFGNNFDEGKYEEVHLVNDVDLNSGAVTMLLNEDDINGVWKQTLGVDKYPNFTGADLLYGVGVGYYNPTHIWENGVCTDCGKICTHNFGIGGVCTMCGMYCSCEPDQNGFCTICGQTIVATVTIDDTISYRANLNAAFDMASGKTATITLLGDTTLTSSIEIGSSKTNITLIGGEHTVSASTTMFKITAGTLTVQSGNYITTSGNAVEVSGSSGDSGTSSGSGSSSSEGTYVPSIDTGKIATTTVGTVNISGGSFTSESGHAVYVTSVSTEDSSSVIGSVAQGTANITGGTFIGSSYAVYVDKASDATTVFGNGGKLNVSGGTFGKLYVAGVPTDEVQLSGGTFAGVEVEQNITTGARGAVILADGYAFFDGDGKGVKLTDVSGDTAGTVKLCTVHGWDSETGTCLYCATACAAHDWDSETGACGVCGYPHDHTAWTSGVCDGCGYHCKHGSWDGTTCTICGVTCTEHDWDEKTGCCSVCGTPCTHGEADAKGCTICGYAYRVSVTVKSGIDPTDAGTTTYYFTLEDAIAAAVKASAKGNSLGSESVIVNKKTVTVTLLSDVTLTSTIEIANSDAEIILVGGDHTVTATDTMFKITAGTLTVQSGNYTTTSGHVFYVSGTVTLPASSSGEEGTYVGGIGTSVGSTTETTTSGTLNISGGNFTSAGHTVYVTRVFKSSTSDESIIGYTAMGTANISGGVFTSTEGYAVYNVSEDAGDKLAGGNLRISGGEFNGGLYIGGFPATDDGNTTLLGGKFSRVSGFAGSLSSYLEEYYAFFTADENGEYTVPTAAKTVSSQGIAVEIKLCTHIYTNADGVCDICGKNCDHPTWNSTTGTCAACGFAHVHDETWKNGVCSVCGYQCKHGSWNETTCTICGFVCTDHVWKGRTGKCSVCGYLHIHESYGKDGCCTVCGGYQPAVLNNGVYEISNAGQLFWFAAFVNDGNGTANAVLKADIDLENRTWTPIGQHSDTDKSNNISYEGTFDGDYHVIRNLNVKLTSTYEAGLFSRTYGATLKNFGVINATVESTQGIRSGVIGGEIHKSTVTNVFTAGDITVKTSNGQAGGIAGECADSTLTNCITTYGTLCATVGSVTNGFYLADTANANSVGENKTKTQFESGELAWLLNGDSSEGVWKQTIDADAYPNFTGKTVYYDANQNPQYYNDQIASVTITWTDMSFSYHKGTWNTDTMTWEGGGYVADDGCGTVTVTNTGNVDVNARFSVTITDDSLGISVSFTENDVLLEDKKLKVLAGQTKTVAVKLTGNEPSEYIETAKTIGQITVTLSTE